MAKPASKNATITGVSTGAAGRIKTNGKPTNGGPAWERALGGIGRGLFITESIRLRRRR
jgi:hypothetical protein